MGNAIEVLNVSKSYGDFALKDVSFCLPGGSIMGLIGENGAGKTTIMKCILDMIHRDSGTIRLLGEEICQGGAPLRQDVGAVLDERFFHDCLRPLDVGKILSPIYENWDSSLFSHYLTQFDLPAKKMVGTFSRGMKMKLSLAAALAHHPQLLILDEATAGLDPVVRDEILEILQAFIQDEDHSVLLSSHITSDLEKVADYITYLHQGQVLLSRGKDDILDHYGRAGCPHSQLSTVDSRDYLFLRQGAYGAQLLVADRHYFQKKYPDLLIEPTTLEEIMLFVEKGESP